MDSELHDYPAFGTSLRRSDLGVIVLACAGAAAAAAIVATGGVLSDPTVFGTVLVAYIATLALGCLARRLGRPSSLFATLLLAEGLLISASSLSGSPKSLLHLLGILRISASAFRASCLPPG